ncbi:MAG: phosphoribosylanthranilate isomerase [Cyanobacteria bacterium]|nr:phosphoribosylanthranilate isomerase [Cyanobacteriota bacterium]MDW8199784.1 phosphoribosylanthranilate isomerase [Cyanobacteriota bacterium SKYGB_h_bin112]
MRIKICGITKPEQAAAIVQLGVTALGFICVPSSPRYVSTEQIQMILQALPQEWAVQTIGVVANRTIADISALVAATGLTGIQLHGTESPGFCQALRTALPRTELIKAIRIRSGEDLASAESYSPYVDALLLDAYHPHQLGGTGTTLDWQALQAFRPSRPWFLAGGLTPENIRIALGQLQPDGIDLSSGVEIAPGDKDVQRVASLMAQLG